MIGVPQDVLDVKARFEAELGIRSNIWGIGLTYDGDEWAVFVVRGPGLHAADIPSEVDGVKILSASLVELANKEA